MSLRWVLGAAAWAAFSAAIWFAGDVLPGFEGPFERFALIVGLGVAWLAWELARVRRSLRENEALLAGIAGHEISLLQKRMADAAAVLRKARFAGPDGARRTVAMLPWYMFIGAPGSGKTTALLNAGLRFPLGDPRGERALEGVGGTRNCDWWFTDQAVLLDTAGRYTTQESDREADAAAWLGFLDLLKRHRPRQPLNGLIVTLSVADLVHWNEPEMARYAAHLRERVAELTARLGVRLPVYVLVTKADMLSGFLEFFGNLDAEGRAQVWGMTFAPSERGGSLGARFEEDFAHLERRLYGVLPARLQEERDLQRRAAIYRFPQQFRGLGPLIAGLLEGAFGQGWRGEPPFVRGVYFTSGTQEGSPIDRVLGTLARSFNLERKVQPPNVGSGKSFFLRRLLHEVIFAEAGLAGVDPAAERARRSLRLAAYAAIAAVTLGVAALWSASYFSNRALVADAGARAAAAARELQAIRELRAGDEPRLLAALNALRDVPRFDAGALSRLALYQGGKISAQAERAYRDTLSETFLPHLALSLEASLRDAPSAEVRAAYAALHEAGDWRSVEPAAQRFGRLPDALRADLAAHLQVALAEQARRRLGGARP